MTYSRQASRPHGLPIISQQTGVLLRLQGGFPQAEWRSLTASTRLVVFNFSDRVVRQYAADERDTGDGTKF